MLHIAYLIPLLPLAGFLLLVAFGHRLGKPKAGWIATAAVGLSFVVTAIVFAGLFLRQPSDRSFTQTLFTWIPVGPLHINFAILIDPLSITMAAFVTGVSTLIHLYSIWYMEHDEQFSKFFVYLNLFVFSMLVLVLSANLLFTFLGWEGVGLCSYLLIAFWFDRDTAATAGKKAFVFNRVGDSGFLLAMFLIFSKIGTLSYRGIFARLHRFSPEEITAIVLLLFLGAVGKSAQIPLFTWLPDAMEGPTPVSALIHAATMVTAGVYLMARVNPLLHLSPDAGEVIAIIGVATAFVAATIACTQNDIKKVLAYLTVSQLGYMFLAIGTGAYVAAIFLMIAHAFFKALLFLSAGSVIHAVEDDQDMKRMGGLRRFLPVTYVTFIVAWLSIAGVPPFSGFWAKGDILVNAFSRYPGLWVVGVVTAALTAYYMARQFFLVFTGSSRWESAHPAGFEPHEGGWIMRFPLVALAVLAGFGGFVNLPFHPQWNFLGRFLAPVFQGTIYHQNVGVGGEWVLALTDVVMAAVGIVVAWRVWYPKWSHPSLEPAFLQRSWMVDDLYDAVIGRPGAALASFAAAVVDNKIIDGAVVGVGKLSELTGVALRKLQTGFVRNYALGITIGLVLLIAWMASRVG